MRLLFDSYIKTGSLSETKGLVNQKYKTRTGRDFSKSTIFGMLRNPVYIGKIKYGGKVYDGEHESIVRETKYLKVQSLLKEYTPKMDTKIARSYLLAGLVRCGDCGSVMTPTYTKKKKAGGEPGYVYYYRCTKTYQYGWNACSIRSVNALKIEGYVIEQLKKYARKKELIHETIEKINLEEKERTKKLDGKEEKTKKELGVVERQIENFLKAIAEGGDRFSSINDKLQELEDRKKVLINNLNEIKIELENEDLIRYDAKLVLQSLKDFIERIQNADEKEKKTLLQLMIKKIIYGKKIIRIELFYLPAIDNCMKERSEMLPMLNRFRTISFKVRNELIISKSKK